MKSISLVKKSILIIVIISISIAIFTIRDGVSSYSNNKTLTVNTNFELQEYSVKQGNYENLSVIDFELPSSSWSIDDIELNFTHLEFGIESKIIEDNDIGHKRLMDKSKSIQAFGIQLMILDPIILYGVQIFGSAEFPAPPTSTLYIQINGYNSTDNTPNQIINASTILNISTTLSWYNQFFQDPLYCIPGNYYLVLNGTEFLPSDNSDYYWHYNDVSPQYPSLNTSYYDGDGWILDSPKTPFLVKLIQKVNQSIFPEEINMSAKINSKSYKVSNGATHGKGYLKKNNINYHPYNKTVKIKVKNNKTEKLNFNIVYNINISNVFKAFSILNIKYNLSNEWIIRPEITRFSDNHTVQFNYPKSWYNLKVFKNQQDISSDIIIEPENNYLLIPNNIIENNATWEIRAESSNIEFTINAPKTQFIAGQRLSFSVNSPLPGNYTFLLIDPLDLEEYQITKILPLQENIFSYNITSNAIEGNYIAYVFWNNETDAGVQSQVFSISHSISQPEPQDFTWLLIIGIILTGGIIIGVSSYVIVKKIESKKRDKLKLFLEKCNDIMNLKYIIVIHPKTGIDVYSQSFEEKELDPTLISGFLQAIHNFGTEVIDGAKESRTVKVEYKNSIILMTEFINLRLIVIMKSNPSKNFLYSIESLAYHIYKYYGKLIEDFEGDLKPFRSIQKLIDSDLSVSFRYPLTISISKNLKLDQNEKEIIKRAKNFMKENRLDYFYGPHLLPDNMCGPKDYEAILSLIKKGVFRPNKDLKI